MSRKKATFRGISQAPDSKVVVYLGTALKARLRLEADRRRMSVSTLLRDMVMRYVDEMAGVGGRDAGTGSGAGGVG